MFAPNKTTQNYVVKPHKKLYCAPPGFFSRHPGLRALSHGFGFKRLILLKEGVVVMVAAVVAAVAG